MSREAIGEIECPLCQRNAELHESAQRGKVDPDSTDGQGRPSYPKKFFVVCPPTSGYRGCGTILANSAEAQARLMDQAHVFGPGGRPTKKPAPPATPKQPDPPSAPTSSPAIAPTSTSTAKEPPKPPPKKPDPFRLW